LLNHMKHLERNAKCGKIKKRPYLIIFLLLGCMYSGLEAIMVTMSLQKLTRQADAIIEGVVEDVRSEWSENNSVIQSVAILRVQQVLKGDIGAARILIQYPGGQVGDIGLKVEDMPTFRKNEKVLVFMQSLTKISNLMPSPTVRQSAMPAFGVLGGAQGKFSVVGAGMARRSGYELASQGYDQESLMPVTNLRKKIKNYLGQAIKQ
jgi:hypothetical protein